MKFLLSIPCQLIVVIFIAITVSSLVAKPLQPLNVALSSINAPDQPVQEIAADTLTLPFDLRAVFVALAASLATFVLWHAYWCYRSESAIAAAQKVGANVTTKDGLTGLMRYMFSDVQVNLANKRVSARTVANLQQIHNLTSLNVANCDVGKKTLFQFEYCRFLKEIDVRDNPLSRDVLLKFRRKISATLHHSCE